MLLFSRFSLAFTSGYSHQIPRIRHGRMEMYRCTGVFCIPPAEYTLYGTHLPHLSLANRSLQPKLMIRNYVFCCCFFLSFFCSVVRRFLCSVLLFCAACPSEHASTSFVRTHFQSPALRYDNYYRRSVLCLSAHARARACMCELKAATYMT